MKKSSNTLGFLKTTGIGGLFFLLPLIVVGALIGQIVPIVLTIAQGLHDFIPVKTPGGIAILVGLAIAILLLLCFGAGLLARRSLGKRLSQNFEKQLLMLFPRYAIIKDQMASSIGADANRPQMIPVLVTIDGIHRIGFEVDREDAGPIAVYLPGSPDPWSGSLAYFPHARVQRLEIEFGDAVSICEQMGRNSTARLPFARP